MAVTTLTSKVTPNPHKPGTSGASVIVFALNFIKEDLRNGKMFPGGSDTMEKMRDMFTHVLCGCQRPEHVTKTFRFKRPGRAVI